MEYLVRYGRNDQKAYTWFVNVYLVCASGKKNQEKLLHSSPSQVYSICDEVLVLWFMENNWLIWADMKASSNTKKSSLEAKYTVPGDKGGGTLCAGWNEAGKLRYNKLFNKIEKARKSVAGKQFDDYYATTRDPKKKMGKKKAKPVAAPQTIKIRNTLSMLCGNTLETSTSSGETNRYITPPTTNNGVPSYAAGAAAAAAAWRPPLATKETCTGFHAA